MKRRTLMQGACASALGVAGVARAASAVKVGIALPFTSVQSEVALDLRTGYELAFTNAGLQGVDIEPVWADDESKAEKTAQIVEGFGRDRSIVATTGIVGTPHAKAALPRAVAAGLPVVGLRSGAVELRDGARGVYHLRASYADELSRTIAVIRGAGLQRLAVVYSQDAFGTAALEHVRQAAAAAGITLVTTEPADRNGADIQAAVARAIAPGRHASAMLMLVLEAPMLKGVAHARTALSYLSPIYCMSFCATRRLADASDAYLVGLGLQSAFPLPRTDLSALASGFRRLALQANKPGAVNSLTAFEGYVYGSVLGAALQRAREPSRAGLTAALAAPLDVGGLRVAFDGLGVGYHHLQLVYKSGTGVIRA